jgi:hypothetical protein
MQGSAQTIHQVQASLGFRIVTPCDMLVGTHEHEIAPIERARIAGLDVKHGEGQAPPLIRCGGSGVGQPVSGPSIAVNRRVRDGMGMRANSVPVTVVRYEISFG